MKKLELTESVKRLLEDKSRYNVVCYNSLGNIVFSKQFYDNSKAAINTCKRWKKIYHYVCVEDTVVGSEYYNPYK